MQVILTEEEYNQLKLQAAKNPSIDYALLQSKILEVLDGLSTGFEEVVQRYGMEFNLNPAGITRDFIRAYTEGITGKFKG